MVDKGTFDSDKANTAQGRYCNDNDCPHFAPVKYCFRCNKDIYEQVEQPRFDGKGTYMTGISVEEAGSELITGCPHCNWSYCD